MNEDDFEAELRAAAQRRKMALVAAGVVVMGGLVFLFARGLWVRHKRFQGLPKIALTPAQQQELKARIEESRKALEEKDQKWRGAIGEVAPGNGACEAMERYRSDLAGNPQAGTFGRWHLIDKPFEWSGSSVASLSRTPFPLRVVKEVPEHSPEAAIRLTELRGMARSAEDATYRTFEERVREATLTELRTTDVLLVLDSVTEPRLSGRNNFKPGAVTARAWVYDHGEDRVVCAGTVTAGSSDTVDPGTTNLGDDLLTNLVRAIPDGVKRVVP